MTGSSLATPDFLRLRCDDFEVLTRLTQPVVAPVDLGDQVSAAAEPNGDRSAFSTLLFRWELWRAMARTDLPRAGVPLRLSRAACEC